MRFPYLQHGRRHGPKGSDPIPGILPIIHGRCGSTSSDNGYGPGIDAPGTGGWSVSGDNSGTFTVTYDHPFSVEPTVNVSVNKATSSIGGKTVEELDSDSTGFTVQTFNNGVLDDDIGFNFVAVGV